MARAHVVGARRCADPLAVLVGAEVDRVEAQCGRSPHFDIWQRIMGAGLHVAPTYGTGHFLAP